MRFALQVESWQQKNTTTARQPAPSWPIVRFAINLSSGKVTAKQLLPRVFRKEFPHVNEAYQTRQHRYMYAVGSALPAPSGSMWAPGQAAIFKVGGVCALQVSQQRSTVCGSQYAVSVIREHTHA